VASAPSDWLLVIVTKVFESIHWKLLSLINEIHPSDFTLSSLQINKCSSLALLIKPLNKNEKFFISFHHSIYTYYGALLFIIRAAAAHKNIEKREKRKIPSSKIYFSQKQKDYY
jgi:hypothetical protein